ncbi:hypothetical protein [Levilactobacillus namurensis]|uniref:Surface layer protein A domain-containing protein n=1 Tax=Levilactobacillus namurensis TaxID=380393 RepID=A0AAW8W5Q1_9LACO|nr:hypothetical protein [Levilactobacillus namurensis]MDT7013865.1 hypothetical protein [Levilactobacillus namurensis]
MANTTASAKTSTPTAAQIAAERAKIAANEKKVDKSIDKIAIRNLFNLKTTYNTGIGVTAKNDTIDSHNLYQTYKLKKPLKLTNEFKHKTVTLHKGSVVTGLSDDASNLKSVDNTTLSIKNQKKVFKKLGNWHYSYVANKQNNGATRAYMRKTAFSANSLASFPMLSVKTAKAQYDAATMSLPFISVTADSHLVYHKSGQTFKATRYAKIKKFKRTHSKITYYLNKRLKSVKTKKTKVGKVYRYKLSFKLGHVFQSRDSYNGDAGAYNLTIKNGKQHFFFPLDEVAESYIASINGNEYVSDHEQEISTAYIQGLY